MQKESIVVISASGSFILTFLKKPSDGFSLISLSIDAFILVRISAAAAFVKVTTRRFSGDTGSLPSVMSFIILSTRTAVLPEPAAAERSNVPPRDVMASFCSFVHTLSAIAFTLQCFPYISAEQRFALVCVFTAAYRPVITVSACVFVCTFGHGICFNIAVKK